MMTVGVQTETAPPLLEDGTPLAPDETVTTEQLLNVDSVKLAIARAEL